MRGGADLRTIEATVVITGPLPRNLTVGDRNEGENEVHDQLVRTGARFTGRV